MYVFYETFRYDSSYAIIKSITVITNKVTCYEKPQESLIKAMQKKHFEKYASYNKNTDKLYVRERVRRAVVKYSLRDKNWRRNPEYYAKPKFCSSFVENFGLGIHREKGVQGR